MQGTDISCECFGAAALVGSLSELPAAFEALTAHVADSGTATQAHVRRLSVWLRPPVSCFNTRTVGHIGPRAARIVVTAIKWHLQDLRS